MRWLTVLLLVLIAVSAGTAAFIRSGIYNFSAVVTQYDITRWLIDTAKSRSVINQAEGIEIPVHFDNPDDYKKGVTHFDASCRACHGAPGEARDDFALGLNPAPPMLCSGLVQKKWNDGQLFWIIKNGLKFTGMPSFQNAHNDTEIWKIVGAVKVLPDMEPDDYREITGESGIFEEVPDDRGIRGRPSPDTTGHRREHNAI